MRPGHGGDPHPDAPVQNLSMERRGGGIMKKFMVMIDEESCWGCRTCEAACRQEFGLPGGVNLISLIEEGPRMVNGRLDFIFRLNLCRHCDDPPCRDACPDGAIFRRDDGIVIMD